MSGVANFVVYSQPSDPKGPLSEFAPNTSEYTFVTSTISIALAMLASQEGKQKLTELALLFDSAKSRGLNHFKGDANLARQWIDFFLHTIKSRFPVVIIDHRITNKDMLGVHFRGRWEGKLSEFDSRMQHIYLNGSRVNDMMAAEGTDHFRSFQFLFATTLVHEAGAHLLVTFLGNGRPDTPTSITAPGYAIDDDSGESGRYLELQLFGGTTEYYYDNSQDARQTGIPHQIDAQGRAWAIDRKLIDNVCQYVFTFPFTRSGLPIDPRSRMSMGRAFPSPSANVQGRAMRAMQYPPPVRVKDFRGYNVRISDIKRIPMRPNRRLVAVK